jgi:integral membrane protein
MSQQPLDKSDFEAALSARKDLGSEMEPELVESFAEKVVAEIKRQQAANPRAGFPPTLTPATQASLQRRGQSNGLYYNPMVMAIVSLVLAIPLTAIALGAGGIFMGLVAWVGIVGINFAAALGNFKFPGSESR